MQKHAAASFQTGGGKKTQSKVDSTGPPTSGHAHISETPGVGEAFGRTTTFARDSRRSGRNNLSQERLLP